MAIKIIRIILICVIAVCAIVLIATFARRSTLDSQVADLKDQAITVSEEPQDPEPEIEEVPTEPEFDPGTPDDSMDFEVLQSENPDIYAWITVPGTNIDYPVLQSGSDKEEDYYLNHNLDLSTGYPGCIYSQLINSQDFSDPVTILYGHNMKNGSYFGSLRRNYLDTDFLSANDLINIYTPGYLKTYRIFATCYYDDRLIPVYYNEFSEDSDLEGFLNETLMRAQNGGSQNPNTEISSPEDISGDILVLSTCATTPTERYLVLAQRVTDNK